ncbi:MAG TPA: SusC/RagA family TonB-linked outer membrane protein, partial [Chitinophagaceae bacterium]|nr:SusC/RagA family TonB-linked outer membrane protein [Chitinophagaceae bacterium]
GEILVISSVGYTTQELLVGDSRTLSISLEGTSQQMTEVVVTALGIKKQSRSVGYSTTQVPGSDFTHSRETNLGNALTGQIAGVNVAGTATGPSGSSRVIIRGNASLAGNNQPLYVIDGIPFDNTNQGGTSGQWGGADFGDGLSTINPDDIESIQVLKGVAASALYGYRGGNGAILITTKSGSRNKGLGLELNNNLTFNKVIDDREYQYSYGQGTQGVKPTTAADALASPNSSWGGKLDGSQAVNFLGENYAYTGATNNLKNFYKTGVTNQSSIALTGGNDKGHFRLGLSNLYMTTVIPNSNMKQQGVNFNSTYDVTPKLHMSLTANYVFEKVKNRVSFSDAPGNVVASVLYLANSVDIRWLKPAVKADGSELLPGTDIYFNNPYFVAYRYQNTTDRNRLTAGLTMKYDLTKWLSAQGQVTRDGYIFDVVNIVPTGTGYSPGGTLTQYTIDYHELNGNFSLEANKQFSDVSLRVVAGGNTQDNVNKIGGMGAVPLSGQGPAGPFKVPFFYSSSNISDKPYAYYFAHYRVNSLYGSADIGFRNYLFLTVTARNDWFSTLNKNSNDILYPSVSGSFVFSDVLHLPSWINFGKIRASYAQSSNGTKPYRNLLTYSLLGFTIGGQSLGSITQTEIPNNFLKPISIKEQEIGVNLQFLNGRAGIDLAVYNKKTEDDILGVTISPTSGYTGNVVNIGELRNRGVELLLTGTPVKTKNFMWKTSFNIAVNNNKVLALSEGIKDIVIEGAFPRWGNGVSIKNIVGLPFAQIVGYGYKRDSASGQIIYGTDGLPLHTSEQIPLGSGIYKTTGGFSNQLQYKNFSLAFLFDFKYGAKIYSGTNLLLYNYGLHKNTLQGREGGYVGPGINENKQPNTVNVPAQIYFQAISTGANHVTEEFVYDASFIKLRSVSIGYDLPESIIRNSFIKGLNISLVARNLATLMKHTPNIDPESNLNNTNGQGLELSGYPAVRSLGFNLNVKF